MKVFVKKVPLVGLKIFLTIILFLALRKIFIPFCFVYESFGGDNPGWHYPGGIDAFLCKIMPLKFLFNFFFTHTGFGLLFYLFLLIISYVVANAALKRFIGRRSLPGS